MCWVYKAKYQVNCVECFFVIVHNSVIISIVYDIKEVK